MNVWGKDCIQESKKHEDVIDSLAKWKENASVELGKIFQTIWKTQFQIDKLLVNSTWIYEIVSAEKFGGLDSRRLACHSKKTEKEVASEQKIN